ncbi:MAG: signal peptidase I [Bifidobacteriaceae bacterium]|nr:signal peptidase I [Bifidobacteriaceae bacterium]
MKTLRIVQRIALMLLSAVGIATVLATVVCLAMNIRPVVVISGSMEPELPVGALVFHQSVPGSELEVGDVVTVPRNAGEGVVTHRVAGIEKTENGEYALTLRGDANKKDDPEQYVVSKADRLVTSFPVLGGVLLWMRANPIPAAAALLALLIFSLWPAPRFSVHLPDGRVIKNLTRREAEAHAAAHRNAVQNDFLPQGAGAAALADPNSSWPAAGSQMPAQLDLTQPIAPVRAQVAQRAPVAQPMADQNANAVFAPRSARPAPQLNIPRAATPAVPPADFGPSPRSAAPAANRSPRRIPFLPVNAA